MRFQKGLNNNQQLVNTRACCTIHHHLKDCEKTLKKMNETSLDYFDFTNGTELQSAISEHLHLLYHLSSPSSTPFTNISKIVKTSFFRCDSISSHLPLSVGQSVIDSFSFVSLFFNENILEDFDFTKRTE